MTKKKVYSNEKRQPSYWSHTPIPKERFLLALLWAEEEVWGEEMKALPDHTRPFLRTQSTNHKGIKRGFPEETGYDRVPQCRRQDLGPSPPLAPALVSEPQG